MAGFMNALKKEIPSVTENGAVGYKHTDNALLDIAFKVPTLRRESNEKNLYKTYFEDAFEFDKNHALKWLLYLRDIRGGLGERDAFRNILVNMSNADSEEVLKLINECKLDEYGRWDDLIYLYANTKQIEIKIAILKLVSVQFDEDINNMNVDKPCSLLAKWMPSINASSKKTRKIALELAKGLHLTKANYRCCLSSLREYLNVIETKMSSNKWNEIDYNKVPSKANLIYSKAFMIHDSERRMQYIDDLKSGKKDVKINADTLMPYDIVHKYGYNEDSWYSRYQKYEYDEVMEQMWKALPSYFTDKTMIPVVDVSGSMTVTIGNKGTVSAMDVSIAMGIYCAQHNKSKEYGNKFITFSYEPNMIDIGNKSLRDSIDKVVNGGNIGYNTDAEAVFDLILKTAIKNKLSQKDIPNSILFISDMEFDDARAMHNSPDQDTLMEIISKKYEDKGYEMPKLIFWNVNSRTNTIPITKNKNGLILVSGFSTSIFKMICSEELDPYKALCKELDVPRYSIIDEVFA